MFTDEGNKRVNEIVEFALDLRMTYNQTLPLLYALSNKPGFEEATDTAVRECVYAVFNK
jgi:hypothetical protein